MLKGVFEAKISEVTLYLFCSNIPLYKNFRENWKNIDFDKIQCYEEKVKIYFTDSEIEAMLKFDLAELTKTIVRHDYWELIELSVIFLDGNIGQIFKINPPGAMHQAR